MSKPKPAKPPKTGLSRPVNPSAPELNTAARRAVLRGLSGGALFAAVIERLPGGWQRPIVSAAALPAHAQSSPLTDTETAQGPEAALSPAILPPSTTANPPLFRGVWRTNSAFRSVHFAPVPTTGSQLEDSAPIPQAAGAQSLTVEATTTSGLSKVSFRVDSFAPVGKNAILTPSFEFEQGSPPLSNDTRIWIKVGGSATARLDNQGHIQADYQFNRAVHVHGDIYIVQRLGNPPRIKMNTNAVLEGQRNIEWEIIMPRDASQVTFSKNGDPDPYSPGRQKILTIGNSVAHTTTAEPTTVAPTTTSDLPRISFNVSEKSVNEGDSNISFVFTREHSLRDARVWIQIGGTATGRLAGENHIPADYEFDLAVHAPSPNNDIFVVEKARYEPRIRILTDSLLEGTETIEWTIIRPRDASQVPFQKKGTDIDYLPGDPHILTITIGDVYTTTPTPTTATPTTTPSGDHVFITVWGIAKAGDSVTIPAAGDNPNYSVYWGDGKADIGQTGSVSHRYEGEEFYEVKIIGRLPRLDFGSSTAENRNRLSAIKQWGHIEWESMESAFEGCEKLNIEAGDTPDLSRVTRMNRMFANATGFTGDLRKWKVGNVSNMKAMFRNATSFNGKISEWDVSNVRNMKNMFSGVTLESEDYDVLLIKWSGQALRERVTFHAGNSRYSVNAAAARQRLEDHFGWDITDNGQIPGPITVARTTQAATTAQPTTTVTTTPAATTASPTTPATATTTITLTTTAEPTTAAPTTTVAPTTIAPTTTGLPRISFRVSDLSANEGDPAISFDFDRGELDWNTRVWIHAGGDAVGRLRGENTPADYTFNNAVRAPSPDGNIYVVEWAVLVPQITLETDALAEGPEKIIWTIIKPGDASQVSFTRDGTDVEYSIGAISQLTITIGDVYITTPEPTTTATATTTITPTTTAEPTTAAPTTTATTTPAPTTVKPTTTNPWIPGAFVTTWRVTAGNRSITIPANDATSSDGTVIRRNYTVDWGDNSAPQTTVGQASHAYAEGGTYTVQITGQLPWIKFNPSGLDRNKIRTIEQWGDIQWRNMKGAFRGCENLRCHATDTPDLSRVTDISAMFREATNFTGDLSGWDVSRITLMHNMFEGVAHFNSDISGWNVGNVVDMSHMFQRAVAFNQNISGWDVSNVTNMDRMFNMAEVFPGPPAFDQNLGGWDVQSVAGATYDPDGTARGSMASMFAGFALSPENYDALLIGWSAQDVKSAVEFGGGNSVTTGTLEAEDARRTLASKGWEINDGQGNLNWIDGAFITTWEVESSDLSITIPAYDFGSEVAEYTVDWGDNRVDQNTTGQAEHTYAAAGTYTVRIIGRFPWINFGYGNVSRSQIRTIEQWGDIEWATMSSAFRDCENLQNNATDTPDLSRVTDMSNMFRGATHFKGDNLSDWDVSNIVDMAGLFWGATDFNGDISSWNVRNVIHMTNMFTDVILHTTLYDDLLIGWSNLSVQRNVTFDPGTAQYTTAAASARQRLRNAGWRINDSGFRISGAFVTIWQTGSPNQSITIPAYAAGSPSQSPDYTVDWGDGEVSENQTGQATHRYADAGTYIVQITGTLPRFWGNQLSSQNRAQILSIEQWGNIQWMTMNGTFSHCLLLKHHATDTPDLSQVTDMSYMFQNATSLDGDMIGWDASNVTNMQYMFQNATSFNGDLTGWDASNVIHMNDMFRNATSFNGDLSGWDVSNVTNMRNMFRDATSFSGKGLGSWDVGNVRYVSNMFSRVTLSTENYDALLIGWASLPSVQRNIYIYANSSQYYSSAAEAARKKLKDDYNWSIYDGGIDENYVPPTTITGS